MLVWISPILRYLTSLLPSSIRAVGLRSNGSLQISVCKHMTVSISKKVLYIKTLDKTSNFCSVTFRRTQLVRRPANLPARMAYWKVTAERKRSLRCQERWQFCRYKINFAGIKKCKKNFFSAWKVLVEFERRFYIRRREGAAVCGSKHAARW